MQLFAVSLFSAVNGTVVETRHYEAEKNKHDFFEAFWSNVFFEDALDDAVVLNTFEAALLAATFTVVASPTALQRARLGGALYVKQDFDKRQYIFTMV